MDNPQPVVASSTKSVPISRYVVYFLITVVGLSVDLFTKWWVFRSLGMPGQYTGALPESAQRSAWWLWNGVFGFQTSLNEGALFGMGQGMIPLFAVMSLVAIVGLIIWLFWFNGADSWLITVIAGFISAGILGNLYDRLGFHGLIWNYSNELHQVGEPVYAVRDWILVMFGKWPWPNFNIADSMMVVSVAILFLYVLLIPDQPRDEK